MMINTLYLGAVSADLTNNIAQKVFLITALAVDLLQESGLLIDNLFFWALEAVRNLTNAPVFRCMKRFIHNPFGYGCKRNLSVCLPERAYKEWERMCFTIR